ncbi:arsenic resistance N-acetyltransferase ArsN2 [Salinimicrobium catena]|uniref:arsenic resistance N-acetyltransferase ArsN2 n=1 Tax=Salinimicrobium catena TaxID=390640 RepID=UPI002FE494D4
MELNIQTFEPKDLTAVTEFLTYNKLPASDLTEDNIQLFLAYDEEELIATIGLEKHGSSGLLRSLAVKENYRNLEVADKMIKGLFAVCESQGISDIYLLTTTAEKYFLKKEFLKVDRKSVPFEIRQSREFRSICPASAVAMHRQVESSVIKGSKDDLEVRRTS